MVYISQLQRLELKELGVVRQGDEVIRVREIVEGGLIYLRGVAQNSGMSYPEPTPTPVAPLN